METNKTGQGAGLPHDPHEDDPHAHSHSHDEYQAAGASGHGNGAFSRRNLLKSGIAGLTATALGGSKLANSAWAHYWERDRDPRHGHRPGRGGRYVQKGGV